MKKLKAWLLKKSPPWMLKFKAKYPKTFWVTMAVLIILPFSPITFALLHSMSHLWALMFAAK